ncbi:MAG: RND transporter, partial [Burkholderiales bacterium]|nr:RND transporter [Burkholderiales bacterium]
MKNNKTRRTESLRPLKLGVLVLALGLGACADMSGVAPAQAKMRSPASLGLAADTAPAPAVSADWWRGFGDAQLDRLVAQALTSSPSMGL